MAERTGLEPATPGVTGRYSNQLNYRSTILLGRQKNHLLAEEAREYTAIFTKVLVFHVKIFSLASKLTLIPFLPVGFFGLLQFFIAGQ